MSDPFKIDGPTCISFSGGRTSAYMLWRVLQSNGGLPSDAVVCFANTGKEDEATLRFVSDCAERWSVPVAWVEYRDDAQGYAVVNFETASRNGEPFEALIEKKKYLPNAVTRFCSHELKNKPIAAFCGLDESDTMIGVRSDEPLRIPKMRARGFHIPLVAAGIAKRDVRAFWKSQPFDLELAEINGDTQLGNCDLCFLKGFNSIFSMISQKPSRAVWWAKQDDKRGATFHKSRPTYGQMKKYADDQQDFLGHNEETIACFCGD
jgi:hypothetical protein